MGSQNSERHLIRKTWQKMNSKTRLESILDTTTVSAGCLKADGMNLCPFVLVITSAGRSRQAPYQRIEQDLRTYIDPEHLPGENFKITDPRLMRRSAIVQFFTHIAQRQRIYDLPEVFRIKHAHKGRKASVGAISEHGSDRDGAMSPSGTEEATHVPDVGPAVPKRSLSKRRKSKNTPNITSDVGTAGPAGGAAPIADPPDMPGPQRPKAKKSKVTLKITKPNAKKKKSQTTLNAKVVQAAPSHTESGLADGIGDQSNLPPRPRPKPKPKGKKSTNAPQSILPDHHAPLTSSSVLGNDADLATAVGTAHRPLPEGTPQTPITNANIIVNDLIDPALRAVGTSSPYISNRPQVNTADNLALIEAHAYMTIGKQVPKKRT